jgi:hypothetical protein
VGFSKNLRFVNTASMRAFKTAAICFHFWSTPMSKAVKQHDQEIAIKPRALSEGDAAIYANISVSALRKCRIDGARKNHIEPPPFVRLGRRIVYLIDDLDVWLEKHRVECPDRNGGIHA